MGGGCTKKARDEESDVTARAAGTKRVEPAPNAPVWDTATLDKALLELGDLAVTNAVSKKLLSPRPLPPSLDPAIQERMNKWDFDVFTVPYDQLNVLAHAALYQHLALFDKLDRKKLWRFVVEVERRYHQTRPFHNFRHAVDVLLATSTLVRLVQRNHPELLSDPLVVGALLVAALAHDSNHPGVMNPYLLATKHGLAATAQGAARQQQAVLEHHHLAIATALLNRPELQFLPLSPAERTRFTSLVEEAVLATDVTTTGARTKELTALVANGESPTTEQLTAMIIKAADISNPTRPLPVYQLWIKGVLTEFYVQGDAERARGLPISMNCDRHTVVEAKCQVGFISFLVAPLYKALHSYAPALSPLIEQLEANRVHFVAEAERPASQEDLRLDPINDAIPVTPVTTSLAKKAAPEQRARA